MARHRRPLKGLRDSLRGLRQLVETTIRSGVLHPAQRVRGVGPHGAPIQTGPDRTVLLFFEDIERDTWVRGDRYLRRFARRSYHSVTEGRRVTGFESAFQMLRLALETAGCRVVVNNYALAARNPQHPVGLCGYPHILRHWTLPNPVVLGPGFFDHPAQAASLMEDPRIRSYLVPCDWMLDLFAPVFGRCNIWFGGLNVGALPDHRDTQKSIDVLVYKKILWDQGATESALVQPVLAELRRRGLTVEVLQYGSYDQSEYLALLACSRSMIFLCEHETQGLAYQQAMAHNVPILAWDQGLWLDPIRTRFTDSPVRASSVPYFSAACGDRFSGSDDFAASLDRFFAHLGEYEPRQFVTDHLSLAESARRYLEVYTAAALPHRGALDP